MLRPDPRIYDKEDIVLARRTVKSNKAKNAVDKTEFPFTGPWEVKEKLDGASYKIKHSTSGKVDKRHAMHLSPVPPELIAFSPLDGADTRYGQLWSTISDKAYKNAGINGFLPHNPFQNMKFNTRPMSARAAPVFVNDDRGIPTMPTLAEFNAELTEWTEDEIEAVMYPSPPPSPTAFFSMAVLAPKPAPGPPSLNELV